MPYGNSFGNCLPLCDDPRIWGGILQQHVAGGMNMAFPPPR